MNKSALALLFGAILFLIGCGGEWAGGEVGKASCSFGSFNDFIPAGRKPVKIASNNNENYIFILDESYYVHTYKRDNLSVCAFDLEKSDYFSGLPKDVISVGNGFYVQDGARLKSWNDVAVCDAKDGVFAIYGNELAIGSNMGIERWTINTSNSCTRKTNISSSQRVLALASTSSEYFAAEGISTEPRSLTRYPKNSGFPSSDIMSSTLGNEKNFCSADRIAVNNHGVYLLDKKCGKIGVYDNQAVWRKTINLDSLNIRNILDIAPAEYQYIFILHSNGVEKISIM